MSDYKEQVNSLREHADLIETSIELYGPSATRLLVYDLRDAAAAIEALQAQVESMDESCKKQLVAMASHVAELQAEVKRLNMRCADCEYASKPWPELEPKLGEWVEENRRPRSSQFVCSECHRTAYDPQPTRDKAWRKRCRYAYCPNCGARMDEPEPPKEDA